MLVIGSQALGRGFLAVLPSTISTISSVEAVLINKSACGSAFFKITWKFYHFFFVIIIYKQKGFPPALKGTLLTITVSEAQGTKSAPKLKMKAKIRFLF